jgi:hypothetical protein
MKATRHRRFGPGRKLARNSPGPKPERPSFGIGERLADSQAIGAPFSSDVILFIACYGFLWISALPRCAAPAPWRIRRCPPRLIARE